MKMRINVVAAICMATGCSSPDESTTRGPDTPANVESTSGELGVEGTLVHTERFGESIKVEFWRTETGAASIVTGSVDRDQQLSNEINAALERSKVTEAYLALPGRSGMGEAPAALRELQADIELAAASRVEVDGEREQFDAEVARLDTEPGQHGLEAAREYRPLIPGQGAGLRPLGPPAGWNWASDYQWFRDSFCYQAQDCRTGFTWLYGGAKSNLSYHRIYGLNNSFDGPADFGSRYARWENGAWVWRIDTRSSLQPRTYMGITRYQGVGPFLRDAWVSGYRVDNVTAASPTFSSTPLSTDPRTSLSQLWHPFQMKGYTSNLFGSTYYNRCANNVHEQFETLPSGPSAKIAYQSRGGTILPPFNAMLHHFDFWDNHMQGIARLPGVGDNRWIAATGSHDLNRTGIFLAHFGDVGLGDGTAFGYSIGNNQASRRPEYFYPITGVKHPGGLQAFGKYVAVAVEAPTFPSFVEFFNFSTPGSTTASIQRFYLSGDQAENPKPTRVIGGVGVTKLADSRYLMFVLGQDKLKQGWFYVSDTTSITANTRWSYLGFVSIAPAQNAQLITECGTGDIFLLSTHNTDFGVNGDPHRYNNEAYLRRLSYSNYTVSMELLSNIPFDSGDNDYCTFYAAVSPYVDPSGKLSLHCSTHHAANSTTLKMAEYAR
jgi:hypothetical protein